MFEKSRLVMQAYKNFKKEMVLTQSPIIQQVSQRLILCFAATLGNVQTKLYLRDVTQAYVQSTSDLNRDFYIRPPVELATMLGISPDCVLMIVKPLYYAYPSTSTFPELFGTLFIRNPMNSLAVKTSVG